MTINPAEWEAVRDDRSWLKSTIVVNGVSLHVDAFEIEPGVTMQAASGEVGATLADLHEAVAADGPWETLRIDGRDYVLIATPFC